MALKNISIFKYIFDKIKINVWRSIKSSARGNISQAIGSAEAIEWQSSTISAFM